MIAAIALLLTTSVHGAIVRAPIELGRLPMSSPSITASPSALSLPSYLSVANPADGARVAAVLQAAQASPTALAVLAKIEKAVEARGRPIVVEVVAMPEAGTWNLDWGILSLRDRDMKGTPRENVSTLIHELQHMLQVQAHVPSDLLETELEAYVVDFRVGRELGENPVPGSQDAKAHDAFKQGLEPFMGYLREQYPEDAQLRKTRSRAYEARLRRGLEHSEKELGRLSRERAERINVYRQMNGLGHSKNELMNYRLDAISPIDAAIQTLERAIAWAHKDISIMASPETRAKARAYARNVVRRARAFQKIFARD